jgi:hypothetical protein
LADYRKRIAGLTYKFETRGPETLPTVRIKSLFPRLFNHTVPALCYLVATVGHVAHKEKEETFTKTYS